MVLTYACLSSSEYTLIADTADRPDSHCFVMYEIILNERPSLSTKLVIGKTGNQLKIITCNLIIGKAMITF